MSHCNTHFYINIRKSCYRISPTGEKVKVTVLLTEPCLLVGVPAWRCLLLWEGWAYLGRPLKKLPVLPTPEPTPFFGVCFMVTFSGHLSSP